MPARPFAGTEMCGAKAILKVSYDFTSGETYSRFKSVIASVAPCYRPLQAHSSHVIQRWVGLYSPLLKDHPFFKGGLLTERPRHRQKDFLNLCCDRVRRDFQDSD